MRRRRAVVDIGGGGDGSLVGVRRRRAEVGLGSERGWKFSANFS